MSLLTGPIWKIATVGAGIISLVLSAMLMSSYFENRDLMNQRTELVKQITDPKTGYVAQLSQSRTNVAQLKSALDSQRVSFELKAKEREAVLSATQAKLDLAQAKTRSMEKRLASFLATGPQGTTLEDRVRDIDARGLAEMVK